MIIDNHIHIGWFSDGYHSPYEVWNSLRNSGVNRAAVSSTSTCAELYHNIVTEFCQLIANAGRDKIAPILWLSPKMLQKEWPLQKLLKSKIEWRGIKLHYISHPEFANNYLLVRKALNVAKLLGNVPVLIHTGFWDSCHAGVFESLIEENPDMKFVLAHGSPIEETISLMRQYPNVWTDTAFMPKKSLIMLKRNKLTGNVMFGTDLPINRIYYPQFSTSEYIQRQIQDIKDIDPLSLSRSIY